MLPARIQRRNEKDWAYYDRRLHCKKCGIFMKDTHPMLVDGEFWHPENGCSNGGWYYDWELRPRTLPDGKYAPNRKGSHVSGIEKVYPKRIARARKRGAKMARKHRPK